jgi:hypothetical protein
VSLQCQQLVTCDSVPDLACAIITTCYELISSLIECAVGEGQDVRAQDLEQEEVAAALHLLLLDQLCIHAMQTKQQL